MISRIALFLLVLFVAFPATAQNRPLDPFRKVFGPPAQTLKQVFRGEGGSTARPAAPPPAEPAAPDIAETEEAEEPPVAAALVPTPRLRPNPDAAPAVIEEPEEPATVASVARATTPTTLSSRPLSKFEPTDEPVTAAPRRFVPVEPVEPGPDAKAPVEKTPEKPAVIAAPADPEPATPLPDVDEPPAETETEILAFTVPLPKPRSAAAAALQASRRSASPSPDGGATGGSCMSRLRAMGVEAQRVAPIRKGRCGIAWPVKVATFDPAMSLTQTATLECETAERVGRWMRDKVNPLADDMLGGRVTGIRVAASYSCRSRNGVSGAKLSEHAYGHAIDISAFKVDGVGWIEVGRASGRQARFLSAVRKSACGPFTTVLGPGSDRYHSDHFHLDTVRRGKKGNSLYCR